MPGCEAENCHFPQFEGSALAARRGHRMNCHPEFPGRVIFVISRRDTGAIAFRERAESFRAQAAKDGLVQGQRTRSKPSLFGFKIANDVRWLGSGPRWQGLGEISLPESKPGSSIMPGKVNPVNVRA